MPFYVSQVIYTAESIAAMIKNPVDRVEAVRPVAEAMGIKILTGGYLLGDYDFLLVFEAPDDTTAAASALAVAASGTARSVKTNRLLVGEEWIESLRKAGASQYRPARLTVLISLETTPRVSPA